MTDELIEGMRAGLKRFELTGEVPSDFIAPDFELHQSSSIVDTAGVFRGENAFQESLAELNESFEDMTYKAESA